MTVAICGFVAGCACSGARDGTSLFVRRVGSHHDVTIFLHGGAGGHSGRWRLSHGAAHAGIRDDQLVLRIHDVYGLTLIADVFNATDKHGVLDVEEEYFWNGQPEYAQWIAPSNRDASGLPKFNPDLPASPFYKTPTRFQQPRTIQVGVKLSY